MLDRVVNPRLLDRKPSNGTLQPGHQGCNATLNPLGCNVTLQPWFLGCHVNVWDSIVSYLRVKVGK